MNQNISKAKCHNSTKEILIIKTQLGDQIHLLYAVVVADVLVLVMFMIQRIILWK